MSGGGASTFNIKEEGKKRGGKMNSKSILGLRPRAIPYLCALPKERKREEEISFLERDRSNLQFCPHWKRRKKDPGEVTCCF